MTQPSAPSVPDIELETFGSQKHNSLIDPDHDSLVQQLKLLVQAEMIAPKWRRPLGLVLLGTTVTLWTASSFLASVSLSLFG